jgi:DNA (cytosine-5)-methyltransferase 1
MSGLIIDLFAGAGGASLGIEAALGRPIDIAVNHDSVALAVHKANHPHTLHVEEDIWRADPVKLTGGKPVELLWASPDCTDFSVAKGGKPRSTKRRTLANAVLKWADAVKPRRIHLENVREFEGWGPLDKNGKRIKDKKGQHYRRWRRNLESLGYVVESRVLDASLYGVPTRRKRLFIIAIRDGSRIVWPEFTHADKKRARDLFTQALLPLRTAGECIDWSLACPSIFEREDPLADKTLDRIRAGVIRFVIEAAEPFIVGVGGRAGQSAPTGASDPVGTITAKNDRAIVTPHLTKFQENSIGQDVREPLDTVMAGAPRFGVVAPVMVTIDHNSSKHGSTPADAPLPTTTVENRHAITAAQLLKVNHGGDEDRGESLDAPLSTVTAARRGHAISAASLIKVDHGDDEKTGRREHSLDDPLTTIHAGGNGHALAAATLIQSGYGEREGQAPRAPGLDKPLGTIVASATKHDLVAAFIEKTYGDRNGEQLNAAPVDAPLPTVTSKDHNRLAAAHLARFNHDDHGSSCAEPMPTITAGGHHIAEVRAFLAAYYGCDKDGQSLNDPMRTVTTKDRFGLVTVHGVDYQIVDIGMRMLEPHELLRAQFGKYAERYDLSCAIGKRKLEKLVEKAKETGASVVDLIIAIPRSKRRPTKSTKVRLIGNSVCPEVAEVIAAANNLPMRPEIERAA